jgi:hypothetical protein
MVTKHVFWGKYFGKSVFGHFFVQFQFSQNTFQGKNMISWVFKYFNYIITKIYLKRNNLSVQTASFKYYRGGLVRINIGGGSSVFKVPTTVSECLRGNANRCIASANTITELAYI